MQFAAMERDNSGFRAASKRNIRAAAAKATVKIGTGGSIGGCASDPGTLSAFAAIHSSLAFSVGPIIGTGGARGASVFLLSDSSRAGRPPCPGAVITVRP